MKRIAVFLHGGISHPGSEAYVPALDGLIRRLSNSFEMVVYTLVKPDGLAEPFELENALVKYVHGHHFDPMPKKVFAFLSAFRRDHLRSPFDGIHGFWALPGGFAATIAGRLYRLPVLVSTLGAEGAALKEIGYGNMLKPMTRLATRWCCSSATALSVLTSFQAESLRRHGLRRRIIDVIPFGAEPAFYRRSRRNRGSSPAHLLHVGHLTPVKDHETLLSAFALIRKRMEVRLRIVGAGELESMIRKRAEELGITCDVEFRGYLSHQELPDEFEWADVLLHTSLYEGQAVVICEAAASGLPVVGTRVGLLADLGDSFGGTVDTGNPLGIAEQTCVLLSQPELYKRAAERARAWAAQHNAEWTAERFRLLLTSMTR